MAKQSFVTGQVLTAAQLTSLQQTAMSGGAASAKTANYVLVAADAGTAISMTSTSATTITVNTGLFAAGDTVFIQNLGSATCTITAGTATVNTAGSLILPQYDAGILYFVSSSSAVFYDYIQVGAASPLTTKGDLYTFGTSDTRLGVGANGTILVADSAEATGLKWQAPPTFRARRTTAQSINQNTWTKMQLSTEDWDTASNFDPTTNYRFTPTTAGYYQIQAEAVGVAASASGFNASIYKNGASYLGANLTIGADGYAGITIAGQVYFNGSSDYVELFGFLTAAGTRTIEGRMDGVWIRS
jgi:hypothetical protein